MRHFGQTLKLHVQICHSSTCLLVDDVFAGGSNWSTLRNASSFASRATSASRGRVLMFHLYVHGRCVWTQVMRKSSSLSTGNAAEHTSALSLLFLTPHRVLSFCCITDLSCSCKFCFDLIRTIKRWLCQSDITAELVRSIFNGSTWGVTFQWLRPCSINTTQKKGKKASERLSGEKLCSFSYCVQLCRDSSGRSNGKKHPWHLGVYVIWFPARRCWAEQNNLRRVTSFSSLCRAGQDSSASVVTRTLHMFRTATDEYLHCQFILQSIQSVAWLCSLNVSETKMTSYTVSTQTHSVYCNSRKIAEKYESSGPLIEND